VRLVNPDAFREMSKTGNWQSMQIEIGVRNEDGKQILSVCTRQRRSESFPGIVTRNKI
jgi:hypothetical protein